MPGEKDAIDYFQKRKTPVAFAAQSLFGKSKRKDSIKSIKKGQNKDGSWNNCLRETVKRLELLNSLGLDTSDTQFGEAVEWILWRQNHEHSYGNVFPSPTAEEMYGTLALPTGEKLPSRVSYIHVYGELSLRILVLSGAKKDPRVIEMLRELDKMVKNTRKGIYCCKNCTGSFWQMASLFPEYRMYVAEGLKTLKKSRTSGGSWKGYPFYHILDTLGRIKGLTALEEFEHALPRLSRSVNRDGSWGKTEKDEKTFAVVSSIKSLRIGEV